MASIELIVRPAVSARVQASVRARAVGHSDDAAPSNTNSILALSFEGESLTAAPDADHAACILRDIAAGAAALLEGRIAKCCVPLDGGPWELCLIVREDRLHASVYRTGALPEIRWLDLPWSALALAEQCRDALAALESSLPGPYTQELLPLVERLEQAATSPSPLPCRGVDTRVTWRSAPQSAVRLSFDAIVPAAPSDGRGLVSDLHGLLFRGHIAIEARGHKAALPEGFLFLQLERFVALCRPLLDAFATRKPMHARTNTGDAQVTLRLSGEGRLALGILGKSGASFTATNLDPRDFALPVAEAAIDLTRALSRCDRARGKNLRLRSLRADARALRRIARDLRDGTDKLNDDPSLYRASAIPEAPSTESESVDFADNRRLRYQERWRAEIEGIDLAGVAVTADRVIVPGARELAALDKRTGAMLWSQPIGRAATTVVGDAILRLTARGDAELRDMHDGEVRWSSRIAPRAGSPAQVFSVCAVGLPRLVVIAEGERKLVALDQHTGEARWRFSARSGGSFKFKRVGRLLVTAAGDASLTALDVATGETVWRVAASTPFSTTPCIHNETVFAIGGATGRGRAQLFAVDAFTGATRWCSDLPGAAASAPVATQDIVALVLTSPEGPRLVALRAEDGELAFEIPLGNSPLRGRPASLAAFGPLLIANLPSGRVCAIEAPHGAVRWSRVLGSPRETDIPRRLDVQMRAGALFVPQTSLGVLRPRDGASIADLTGCELVPDLVRIDDDCAVYVGEESGHLRCFEPAARLAVVRAV
ncbi:MAG: PQQ-binding-like beta-propeller repeat protein [Polyangiales bacterium]